VIPCLPFSVHHRSTGALQACVPLSIPSHVHLVVNLLGYKQTKLLDSTRTYSLFWTNLTTQEVEFEVDNVDSN